MGNKTKVFIIDTSVILSGKPLHFTDGIMVTTPGVASELRPGGRDYRAFQLLQEKGLGIESPSLTSLATVKKMAEQTGDNQRLSAVDIEILSLAVDILKENTREPVLLTDDYSIQNVASMLGVPFQNMSQQRITKKFKWLCRCPGCGKQFSEPQKICPICGTATKLVPQKKQDI